MATKRPVQKTKTVPNKVKLAGSMSGWRRAILVVFIVAFGAAGSALLLRSFAATAPLYLSPESQSVQKGSTFTVDVRMNINSTVDSVSAKITYDPAVMDFVSIDAANSVFPSELLMNGGNGTVNINRGTFTPAVFPGGSLVATVSFTAKSSVSSSALQLSGNAAYQGNFLNPGVSGATVTITDPTPPPTNNDTTSPVVSITQPAAGAKPVRSKFIVSASATDNVGVTNMQVVIDGKVVLSTASDQLAYTWSVNGKKVTTGAHTITVRASDAAGNVGSSGVTVYK